jgi:acetyl esterase/lipase
MSRMAVLGLAAALNAALASIGAHGQVVVRDVPYGSDAANKMDIYRPPGPGPFPAIIYIHGGGWWNGDKNSVSTDVVSRAIAKNVAVVSINYRTIMDAKRDNIFPLVEAPLKDTLSAFEFLVNNGSTEGIDGLRIAAFGDSAGGYNALWLGLTVGKNGMRAVGGIDAQTTIDPTEESEWVSPKIQYGGHAFGLAENDFITFLRNRDRYKAFFPKLSPSYLIGPGAPPIYLLYTSKLDGGESDHMSLVHSPGFGAGFSRIAKDRGVAVMFVDGAREDKSRYVTFLDFLIDQVSAD